MRTHFHHLLLVPIIIGLASCDKSTNEEEILVSSVSLNQATAELVIGETVRLQVSISPSNATDKAVLWGSSKQSVATVSNSGLVTAIAEGSSTITATVAGKSATCAVTVSKGVVAVESVSLNKSELTLEKGKSETLVATVNPSDATDKTITWSCSNSSVATVDAGGKVIAVTGGNTVITAKSGNHHAACNVTVIVPVESISLDMESITLVEESTTTLVATVMPDDATDKKVNWSSSDTQIATVDETGKVIAVKEGAAEITAKAGEQKAICAVAVQKNAIAITSITLNKTELSLYKGRSEMLKATVKPDNATDKSVTWSSSNPEIATVDSNGNVTAVGSGNATITAKAGDKQATCAVTVRVPVESVTLDKTSLNLKEGESVTLTAKISPKDATDKTIIWTSSSDNIVTVDNEGKVTGVKEGNATITATTKEGGKKATCSITVEANHAPSVTVEANHISAVSAVLHGKANLGSTVGADLQVGFQYSESAGILPSNSKTIEATDADANYNYSTTITALAPVTKYYFRSFVRQNDQYTYGEIKEFTTKDIASMLETKEATNVKASSAVLHAKLDLTDVEYKSIYYGFAYADATMSTSWIQGEDFADKSYSATLTNRSHNTQYWYRAYVQLDHRMFLGEKKEFTTGVVPVKSVSLDKKEYTFNTIGNTLTLKATVLPNDATDKSVTWSSDNEKVATVNTNGEVTAKGNGTAIITVTTNDQGKTASCVITVDQRLVTSITMNKTSLVLYRGTSDVSEMLTATVEPSDAKNKSITWTSDNTSVATVSASNGNGLVNGKSRGRAIITVKADDGSGVQASCKVEVKQNVTDISLDKISLSMFVGDKASITVSSILPENANDKTYTWSSSNSEIASVDNIGNVTAKAKGTAIIKATANDGSGAFASCSVGVYKIDIPQAIDMGTVVNGKNVKWASFNIGASAPEESGTYYAWGETEIKDYYGWSTYKWGTDERKLTKYCDKSGFGTVDNKTVLEESDDVAHVKLGGSWRMPTSEEWEELRTKCTWTWTSNYNATGVMGIIVTASNGNSIFLPAAGHWTYNSLLSVGTYGYYWSSSLVTGYVKYPDNAKDLFFLSDFINIGQDVRPFGQSVRPVTTE